MQPPSTNTCSRPADASDRVRVDGKFFRVGGKKFFPKGVTYGPFPPGPDGVPFPTAEQVARDFALIRQLNANCLRLYHVPPRWLLELAQEHGLKLLVDVPWAKHTCFLDDRETMAATRRAVREAAEMLAGQPAVFALAIANEIPPDVARWYGARRIETFVDELAALVKAADRERLVTFVNFPTTEFLQPSSVDFVSFNVYLHEPAPFTNYLYRLQSLAGGKPLVLTEIGMDSLREGEQAKYRFLRGHIEAAFRAGLAGVFVFSFTDEWHTGGALIENWFFGITDRQRQPKPSFQAVAEAFALAPYFPLPRYPKVSVVVASYNGARTLPACLESLLRLNYPDYEVILVDDGSTDETAQIAARYPAVRTVHQPNLGLSAARNTGILASTGEIVAFTDSDCRADEDWLHYLVGELLCSDACAVGGPNFPPPDDNWIAGVVAVSPGAPAHVLLTDREAEHIPGCNMAFWKWALEAIHGFDPIYRAAGDDVDVCWRLMQRGWKIAFSHAGFVWHHRRNTVEAYLKQQHGYGVAESLLRHKHPEYFNSFGGMRWRGRIYNPLRGAEGFGRFVIYHGVFGSGLFQTLYAPEQVGLLPLLTSLEWHVLVTLGGVLLALLWPALWPLPALTLLASGSVAVAAAWRVHLPAWQRHRWSRPLIALLYLLQPVVRGWPRYAHRLKRPPTPTAAQLAVSALAARYRRVGRVQTASYWSETGLERIAFLQKLMEILERGRWQAVPDSGWDEFDLVIYGDRFTKVLVQTVCENHGGPKRLLRARLMGHWTLPGRALFWASVTAVAFFVAAASRVWWAQFAWLLVAAVAVLLYIRTRRTMRFALALLDMAAEQSNLTKLS